MFTYDKSLRAKDRQGLANFYLHSMVVGFFLEDH